MLSDFFPRGYRRFAQSRLAQDFEDFGDWLTATGYSHGCARSHISRLQLALELRAWARPGSIYAASRLRQAFDAEGSGGRRLALFRGTQQAFQRFLFLRGRLAPPRAHRFSQLRSDYHKHLVDLRALANTTAQHHDITVADFLAHALKSGRDLKSLCHTDVELYLAFKSEAVSRQRLQHIIAHLRAFLRYCQDRSTIRRGLDVIDTVRAFHDEQPVRALDWSVVQALLDSIDRSSRSGERDYAILHLMAHYGLRPSEVVALRLDSIDWRAETLKVEQCKTRSVLVLPLAKPTLTVLRRFLATDRPQSRHLQLFLRARCPDGALKRYAIGDIFKKRAMESGLPLSGHSVYCLRHSFAVRLLHRGVGIKAIGDVLGHHSLASTSEYLRLDTDSLRAVALAVPASVQA